MGSSVSRRRFLSNFSFLHILSSIFPPACDFPFCANVSMIKVSHGTNANADHAASEGIRPGGILNRAISRHAKFVERYIENGGAKAAMQAITTGRPLRAGTPQAE